MNHVIYRAALCALVLLSGSARANNWVKMAQTAVESLDDRPAAVQHAGSIEYAFSPRQGAEKLILKVIGSARSEIRMMTYSMTSVPVVEALIAARRRGVDVALIVDHKSNVQEDRYGKSRAALSALVNAGCRVRTTSAYSIMHDKLVIVNRETVQTGSFNYSQAAASRNSENVMVVWKNPELARGYLKHWESRFSRGADYQLNY